MKYADANVIKIKHAVLEEVARLAFAGELEERKEDIPGRRRSSAAAFTRRGRSSGRECGWQRERRRGRWMTEM